MKKLIKAKPYISSNSYFFEQKNSRCYLANEKTHEEFLLEGAAADLWHIILMTQDYEKVKQYAESKLIDDELDEFLDKLEVAGFIETGKNKKPTEDNIVYEPEAREEEAKAFLAEKQKWLYENNFLSSLTLELSYKCNLACRHCYNDKYINDKEIGFESAKKIIDSAIKIGVGRIDITSGECTINSDFLKIAGYIRKKRLALTFATNAQALYDDENLFEKIVFLYPHRIRISLYSMNPEIHDSITGVRGSHAKTVAVIKKLCERNIVVSINYFQMSINKNCLPDVVKFQKSVGAEISYDWCFLNNKENSNSYVLITDEQIYDLYEDKNSLFSGNLNEIKINNNELTACEGVKYSLAVSPLSDVYPCVALKYKLGNLKDTGLEKIWQYNFKKFIEQFKVRNLEECNGFDYCKYCFYCPAMGFFENGFMKKSDICCKFAKVKMEVLRKRSTLCKI